MQIERVKLTLQDFGGWGGGGGGETGQELGVLAFCLVREYYIMLFYTDPVWILFYDWLQTQTRL
jgi:hypothetical protein